MQNTKDLREARRRKILERGSDRLAYITGEVKHTLKHTPSYEEVSSVASAGLERRLHEQPAQHLTATSDNLRYTEEALSVEGGLQRSNEEQTVKPRPSTATDTSECIEGTSVQPIQNGFESLQEQTIEPNPATSSEGLSYVQDLSSLQGPSIISGKEGMETIFPRRMRNDIAKKYPLIDGKCLRESIDRSQGIRASMATLIALVVAVQTIFLTCGNAWATVFSICLFNWPIGAILLADVSAIIMLLIFRNQLDYKQEENVNRVSENIKGETNKFSKAVSVLTHVQEILDVGLLLKQIADAIFLDCSIYVVVLVCTLNLGQYAVSC